MLSGAFIAFILIREGLSGIRKKDILGNKDDWKLGIWWERVLKFFIPIAATVLLVWWLSLAAQVDQWFNPFSAYSLMTCLAQWAIILIILVLINRWINKRMRN
jgi:NSS family neurotransmitter:Na+ symporter